ncbi:cobalamin B12-binding domain-containing protein [Streptomyces sp. NRRL S-350]|uniref:cobalamin B12-binding domain-containing protein n=1 Tax=Streptomyces sp. NRRL S-350 TaxID=1463902 RepID=UPI000AB4A1B8|nr:cobalamin-dependent protein [Streptomyces sp. NRRL S-350]
MTTTSSDSHTWNLIYLEHLLKEWGHEVTNLGACVPDELVIDQCSRLRPDIVVVSSVNGHGANDGLRLIRKVRAVQELAGLPAVIGGKLGTAGNAAAWAPRLREAGFDAVFEESEGILPFRGFLDRLAARVQV